LSLIKELQRRNVFRVGAAYVITAWLVIQVVETIFPAFGFGDGAIRIVTIVFVIGLIPSIILAWAFELTPEGVKRDSEVDRKRPGAAQAGKKLDRMIMVVLALALGYFTFDKFVLDPARDAEELAAAVEEAREIGRTEAKEEVRHTSVAVLAFQDLSPEGDQEYFGDGLAVDLINQLGKVPELRVTGKTSAFSFKDKDATIPEIGKALNVGHVLDGSISKAGDRIRISVELVDTREDEQIWSKIYDRTLDDIFAIQDEISLAIVEALLDEMALQAHTGNIQGAARPVDIETYSEYLLGLHLLNRRTPEDFEAAITHFEKAIARDAEFAAAHANLAITYWLLHYYDHLTARAAYRNAQPYAARALELDSRSAQAHAAAFFMEDLQNIRDPELRHLNRAVALNPSYADALNWMASELESWRRYAEADAALRGALEVDPLSMVVNSHYIINLLRAGRHDEAEQVAERLVSLDVGWGLRRVGSIDFEHGHYAGAVSHYLAGLKSAPQHFALRKELSRLFAELGLGTEAERLYANDQVAYYRQLYDGDWERAIGVAEAALTDGEDEVFFTPALAQAHYFARNYAEAAQHFEQVLPMEFSPDFQAPGMGPFGMMFFAMALRETGDVAGAGVISRAVENDVARQRQAGYRDGVFHQLSGMSLLYQGSVDEGLNALEVAFEVGFRESWLLAAPLFDPLRENGRFTALQERYRHAWQENVTGVLALICGEELPEFGWRPMTETCDASFLLARDSDEQE
jgi:adenylate cyclase